MSEYTPTTEEVRRAYRRGILPLVSLEPAFDRWLEEYTRKKQAKAWDEGFDAGEKDYATHELTGDWDNDCTPNPYRQGEN